MAINFNKTWEQRQEELQQQFNSSSIIPNGQYKAVITGAHTERHKSGGYDILVISVEITEGEHAGKQTKKSYFIDEAYPKEKKRKWDEAQFYALLIQFGLSYNTEREFFNVLYDLKNKPVNLTIERSETTNEKGLAYVGKTIEADNSNTITKSYATKMLENLQQNSQIAINTDFDMLDDLI